MVYPIGKHTIEPLVKKLWIKKVNGISNLPKDKPFVFAANHGSFIDDLVIPAVIVSYLDKYAHIYCK